MSLWTRRLQFCQTCPKFLLRVRKFFPQSPKKFVLFSFFCKMCLWIPRMQFSQPWRKFFLQGPIFFVRSPKYYKYIYFLSKKFPPRKCSAENQFWEYCFLSKIVINVVRWVSSIPTMPVFFISAFPFLSHFWLTVDENIAAQLRLLKWFPEKNVSKHVQNYTNKLKLSISPPEIQIRFWRNKSARVFPSKNIFGKKFGRCAFSSTFPAMHWWNMIWYINVGTTITISIVSFLAKIFD